MGGLTTRGGVVVGESRDCGSELCEAEGLGAMMSRRAAITSRDVAMTSCCVAMTSCCVTMTSPLEVGVRGFSTSVLKKAEVLLFRRFFIERTVEFPNTGVEVGEVAWVVLACAAALDIAVMACTAFAWAALGCVAFIWAAFIWAAFIWAAFIWAAFIWAAFIWAAFM